MNKFDSILLIDDDEISNFLCEETIRCSNIVNKVKSFVNADEALDFLTSNDQPFPDIVFLDINMPGMDGWEFLEDIQELCKSQDKQIRVVILSSSNFHLDIEKSRRFAFVTDYVTKPLTTEILEKLMNKYSRNNLSTSFCK